MNDKEYRYFNTLKNYILRHLNIKVDIYPLDHKLFIPMEEDEEVLGCCHKIRSESGDLKGYLITIDEPYIRACYYGRQTAYSPYSDNQLIETICHEIAHLYVWDHNEDHKNLTNELYDFIISSIEKNKIKNFNKKY